MTDYIDRNKESFNELAKKGVKWRHKDLTLQFISGFQMLLSGNEVLDLGCGVGNDALRLKRYDLQVQGLDISEVMLEEAKKLVEGVSFVQGDFRSIPFADEKFDGVWANASFIYLNEDDLDTALAHVFRILKKGGVFFSSFILGEGEEIIGGIYHKYYDEREIENRLQKHGFKIFDKAVTGELNRKYLSVYAIKP